MDSILIRENDSVTVSLETGHKTAVKDIKKGEYVLKYGYPIGIATKDINIGEHVHTHNLKTSLSGILDYTYEPRFDIPIKKESPMIKAFRRSDGKIGIRNDIWIINTVGCVNKTAEILSRKTGALTFPHPFGCSQLSDDHKTTQLILKGLIKHPNAGGVLVLGLGCENNNINEMKKVLGDIDSERIKFLNAQDCENEISQGVKLIEELQKNAENDKRESVPASELIIGLKCGGSDGFSGITANALTGKICDEFAAFGAGVVLTEVPEMFGAETILMNRCINKNVFEKTVKMINGYKEYFLRYNQPVYENPSPGNKEGGITTLEEKSLGCVQKGGAVPVMDVLDYGDTAKSGGLQLLNGPGNDIVAATNLCAAGCHMILFTTGRGTPLGAPVPTLKISSNTRLSKNKPHWIDFDAGKMIEGADLTQDALCLIYDTANGMPAKNEKNGYREISIFKDGVTL